MIGFRDMLKVYIFLNNFLGVVSFVVKIIIFLVRYMILLNREVFKYFLYLFNSILLIGGLIKMVIELIVKFILM